MIGAFSPQKRDQSAIRIVTRCLVIGGLACTLLVGCSLTREISKTPRTSVEQLLLSQAIQRGLHDLNIPLPQNSSVFVNIAGFSPTSLLFKYDQTKESMFVPPSDLGYVREAVEQRLGELGFLVKDRQEEANYRVKVLVQALGTDQGETFFGMPPVQSVLLPFALPELILYKFQDQRAHLRYSIDIFENATGRFVQSTPWYIGSAYYNQYTILFAIAFARTDLILPPWR